MTRATPRIGVLAIQGDVVEHLRALVACDVSAVSVGSLDSLGDVDALIIPGGESTTMSMLASRDGLLDPLREARAAGMPMYGSCAGMIMLADDILDARSDQQAIGGIDMVVRRNALIARAVMSRQHTSVPPSIGSIQLWHQPLQCKSGTIAR